MSLESVNRLADLTGRDRATVTRRLASLTPTPGPKNSLLYDSRDALPLLIDPPTTTAERLDLSHERAYLARRQRELTELKIEATRRELIPATEVQDFLVRAFAAFRAHLLGLPHRLAVECAGGQYHEIVSTAERITHEALNELSELEP